MSAGYLDKHYWPVAEGDRMPEVSFRFRHLTEWGKDLEVMRRAGPVRWTAEQLNELQLRLNANGLAIVSDAIGSLRFDLVDAKGEICQKQ